MSVDGYMNLHLANTEEYIDGTNTGALGEVMIRLYIPFINKQLKTQKHN